MTFSLLPPRQHVWEACTHGTALSISTCMALAWSHLTDNTCYKGGFRCMAANCWNFRLLSLDVIWAHLHGRCAWYAPPHTGARRYPVLTAMLASICVFLRCSVNSLASASYALIMALSSLQRNKSHFNDASTPHDHGCITMIHTIPRFSRLVLPPLKVCARGCVNMTKACRTETVPDVTGPADPVTAGLLEGEHCPNASSFRKSWHRNQSLQCDVLVARSRRSLAGVCIIRVASLALIQTSVG